MMNPILMFHYFNEFSLWKDVKSTSVVILFDLSFNVFSILLNSHKCFKCCLSRKPPSEYKRKPIDFVHIVSSVNNMNTCNAKFSVWYFAFSFRVKRCYLREKTKKNKNVSTLNIEIWVVSTIVFQEEIISKGIGQVIRLENDQTFSKIMCISQII